MIQSIFVLSPTGEVLLERHYHDVTPRSLCDRFWEIALKISSSSSSRKPIISSKGGGESGHDHFHHYIGRPNAPPPPYHSVPPVVTVEVDDHFSSHTSALKKSNATKNINTNSSNNGNGLDNDAPMPRQKPLRRRNLHVFHVLRDGLTYLATTSPSSNITHNHDRYNDHKYDEDGTLPPLIIIELLHRICDTFASYFGTVSTTMGRAVGGGVGNSSVMSSPIFDESSLRDNFSTAYQLLEEMVDHGWPLTTEPNILKDMVRTPTMIGRIQSVVTGGMSDALYGGTGGPSSSVVGYSGDNMSMNPSGIKLSQTQHHQQQALLPHGITSNTPWRSANVEHSNNEIYIDVIEEIDAVIDGASGRSLGVADVYGSIVARSNLSGLPDLLLTFRDDASVNIVEDCSFHPCVRYRRYEDEGVISFVPPDGEFCLMKYRVKPERLNPATGRRNKYGPFDNNNNNMNDYYDVGGEGGDDKEEDEFQFENLENIPFHPPIECIPRFRYDDDNDSYNIDDREDEITATTSKEREGTMEITLSVRPVCSLVRTSSKSISMGTTNNIPNVSSYPSLSSVTNAIGQSSSSSSYDAVEDVTVTIPFSRDVRTTANLSTNVGTVLYDESGKVARWRVGTVDCRCRPILTGTMIIEKNSEGKNCGIGDSTILSTGVGEGEKRTGSKKDRESGGRRRRNGRIIKQPPLGLTWKVQGSSWSGLSVGGLSLAGETYKPYKGVRNVVKSGRYQVRPYRT